MMKLLRRAKNKKGFTMIEMIVALVILAILAAIAVPSMIGFINRANERALLTEARVGFVAAQVCATEGETAPATILASDGFRDLISPLTPTNFSRLNLNGNEVIGIAYTDGTNSVEIGTPAPAGSGG